MNKISICFYNNHKVRAIWDEEHNQWWFSVLEIVGAINEQDDHEKKREGTHCAASSLTFI